MSEHMPDPPAGTLHHVELWVPDLTRALAEWGWLLGELGYAEFQDWPDGRVLVIRHAAIGADR